MRHGLTRVTHRRDDALTGGAVGPAGASRRTGSGSLTRSVARSASVAGLAGAVRGSDACEALGLGFHHGAEGVPAPCALLPVTGSGSLI